MPGTSMTRLRFSCPDAKSWLASRRGTGMDTLRSDFGVPTSRLVDEELEAEEEAEEEEDAEVDEHGMA